MGKGATFDAFLSYNSLDQGHVQRIAEALKSRGCRCFVDRWYLEPGRDWVAALEQALQGSRSVAVFIGPHEFGRWQQRERAWALDRLAEHDRRTDQNGFPVIPVLLPGCDPPMGFMKQLTWIDLRDDPHSSRQLDALAAAILRKPVELAGQPAPRAAVCPYRGLLPFREEDADFFFGRDHYLEKLVSLVAHKPLVAVVAASGTGKSSLVRAGLVPRLRRSDSGPVWDVVRMVPHVDPLYSLAEALVPLIETDRSPLELEQKLGEVANDLESDQPRTPLWGLANAVLRQQPGTDRLLLFVDQWEELYTVCEKPARRTRFIREVLDATARKNSPLQVVFTVRADFYGRILEDRPLLDALASAKLDLGPMKEEELRAIVEGPAGNLELKFETGLVDRILEDAGNEPGRLPLLEFALEELWNRRDGFQLTHAGYQDLGERQDDDDNDQREPGSCLSRAIATYADRVYDDLEPDEQARLPALIHKLVRAGAKAEEDTRRRAELGELDPATRTLAYKLADKRLLITTRAAAFEQPAAPAPTEPTNAEDQPESDRGQNERQVSKTTVEVAHEELLRRWGRLRAWVEKDREFLQWRTRMDLKVEEYARDGASALLRGRQLEEARRHYPARAATIERDQRAFLDASFQTEQARQDQKRRQLRRIRIGAAVAVVAVVAIGLFWYRSERKQAATNLVERLLATPAAGVPLYLEQLASYQQLATKNLRNAYRNAGRPLVQRVHAVYALIRFDVAKPDELDFLLQSIADPKLGKDEGSNLVAAISKFHQRDSMNKRIALFVDQAKDDTERNRYLAVAVSAGINNKAREICRLQGDPTMRSSLIHGFWNFPGDLPRVVETLDAIEHKDDLKSALCIALGTLGQDAADLSGSTLKRLFVESKDAGTHSAAGWALRQQGLREVDLERLIAAKPAASKSRDWYIVDLGDANDITMLKIPGGDFAIGDVTHDANPTVTDKKKAFREFWMSDREVTVGQFHAVMKADKARDTQLKQLYLTPPQMPVCSVTWFDAIEFCNRLSDRADLQPCYSIRVVKRWGDGSIRDALVSPLSNGKGYRLPTENNWEYACRALSTRDYCFGDDEALLLLEYGVLGNSALNCGSKRPNGWGLFDMHGNVNEWCFDEVEGDSRVLRGGSFPYVDYSGPQDLRSVARSWVTPDIRNGDGGFRISRTP